METSIILILYVLGVFANLCVTMLFWSAIKKDPVIRALVSVVVLGSFITWLTVAVCLLRPPKKKK